MSWQDAIGELAAERTRAETCVSLLKRHAGDDEAALDQGRAAYDMAKAEIDGVIAALSVALAKGEEPESFALSRRSSSAGSQGREAFCETALALAPAQDGTKSAIFAVLGEVIGPLIEAAKEIYIHVERPGRARARDDPDAAGGDQMAELRQRRGLSGLAPFALARWPCCCRRRVARPGGDPGTLRAAGAGARPRGAHGADHARRRRCGGPDRGDRVLRPDRAGLVCGGRPARCAPSACRRDRATSARSTPWRSAPTAR